MPAGARRLVRTVLIDSLAHPLRVRVRQNEHSLASAELPLKRRFTDLQLVAVLSPEVSLDALNRRGVRVTYPLLEHLPEHWRGYDGLKALVVHGTSLESLTARQYSALKKWLASGGTLVVSGRADYTLMRTRRLRDLLPAEPEGLLKVSSRELFPDADSHQQIHLHRVKTPSSRVTRRLDQAPLVVSGSKARARCTTLHSTSRRSAYRARPWPGASGKKHLVYRRLHGQRRPHRARCRKENLSPKTTQLTPFSRRIPMLSGR